MSRGWNLPLTFGSLTAVTLRENARFGSEGDGKSTSEIVTFTERLGPLLSKTSSSTVFQHVKTLRPVSGSVITSFPIMESIRFKKELKIIVSEKLS